MIIKSMSRKEASFGQLMDYIDRDGGDEHTRIRFNLLSRDRDRMRAEFEQNAEHMAKRKNGVFMYHEIISITRARGIDLEAQKQRLYEIAQEYMAARAPRNLCYGGLHDDKDHSLHFHLMISANRAGEPKRHRLSKEQFHTIQISLERYVLEKYPELEQKVAIEKTAETRIPKPESELKRRGGKATQREEVSSRIKVALENSRDRESLLREFEAAGLEFYVRGQNIGVIDRKTGKRHRVKTLDTNLPALLQERMLIEPEKVKEPPRQSKPDETVERKSRPADEKENEKVEGKAPSKKPKESKPEPELSDTQRRWQEQAKRAEREERASKREQDKGRERGDDFERKR